MDSITAIITWWKSNWNSIGDWVIRIIAPITAFGMIGNVIMGVIDAGPAFGYTTLDYGLTIISLLIPSLYFVFFRKYEIIVPEWIRVESEMRRK